MNMFKGVWMALSLALLGAGVTAEPAAGQLTFEIPAQRLGDALSAFGKQAGLSVAFYDEAAIDKRAPALKGSYTPEAALSHLLADSALEYEFVNAHTVAIRSKRTAVETGSRNGQDDAVRFAQGAGSSVHEERKGTEQTAAASTETHIDRISEIIVTAQKRVERLQDVPVPVTAISADSLVSSNQLRIQDYYTRIPGFSSNPTGLANAQILAIRGVTTAAGNPTVSVMIDDVPYGGSTSNGASVFVPDIDPSELARVEVLRGPQGTLYGASSMGGLFKYVTLDPSTDRFSGRLQAGLTNVKNGDGIGYSARAAANVPISDTFAIRASAFTRLDPGYIDNATLGLDGINEAEVHGGRVSALWLPSETVSLKVSALVQKSAADGSALVFPAVGDLQQSFAKDTGDFEAKTQAYSAILTADLGRAELTALTGYNVNSGEDSYDYTRFTSIPATQTQFGVSGNKWFENYETEKFSQELRLSIPLGSRVDWLLGAFYTDEDNSLNQWIYAINPTTGVVAGQWQESRLPTTYKEYAVFTDLTFSITDRFDIQLGGRQSKNKQTFAQTIVGIPPIGGTSSVALTDYDAKSFTYLLTPRFKVSPDLMVYARLASGYRPGGPNSAAAFQTRYNPDKTRTYEIGAKGNVADGTFSFDASIYYIDWDDIQLTFAGANNIAYQANGGGAKSEGVELSIATYPIRGMTIAGWVSYNDAVLTEAFPATSTSYGVPGNRLPYGTRLTGNLSIDQELPVSGNVTAFFGGSLSYTGDRLKNFRAAPGGVPLPRQRLPGYAKTDLHAGARYEDWKFELFINNVTDKRGVVAGSLGSAFRDTFAYIQPRTFGCMVIRSF